MPVAYSYIRMSRPEQMRGDSLRRQLEAAEAWASERGVQIDTALRDIGVSAYRGKNRTEGALAAFLALVQEGRVPQGSYLLVESLDRLSREAVLDALPRFIDLIKAGVVVVTLLDGQEYSKARLTNDWTPLILSLAIMARAHEESRTKGTRVRQAWDKKRDRASEAVLTARVPAWLSVEGGRVVTRPERVEIVRRIFAESAAGDGRRVIVRRLNAEGVPTFQASKKRAAGWQPSYVAKLLSNRAVLGEFQPYSAGPDGTRQPYGEPVEAYFPAVVSPSEFHAAGLARRSRAGAPGRRGAEVTNLFLGLARCGCGAVMAIENKGAPPKGGRYLVCSAHVRAAGCDRGRRWRLETVEQHVLRALSLADLRGFAGEEAEPDELAPLEADLASARSRKERLLDLVESGDADAAGRARALTARIGDLERKLAAARTAAREAETLLTPAEQARLLCALLGEMAEATGEARRDVRTRVAQALRLAVDRIVFGPHTIIGYYRDSRARYRTRLPPPRPGEPLPAYVRTLYDDSPERAEHEEAAAASGEGLGGQIPAAWRRRALRVV